MAQNPHTPGGEARLYSRTEVLSLQRHGHLGFAADGSYAFARSLVSVPASMSEIVLAQRHYPVVFAGDDWPIPVIVLGISEPGGNLFVGEDGHWEPHVYVPAFLRRYPFVAIPKKDSDQLVLAADVASDLIVDDGAHPFFVAGKPSERAERAFKLSVRLHGDFDGAREFGGALAEAGLLRQQRAEISFGGGTTRIEMTNFRMIDEAALGAMPDETILEWRKRGWLPPIHAHLMSLACWTDLARRAQKAAS